jgi:hypothetical protein
MSTCAKRYAEFFEQLNAESKKEEYANFFDVDSSFEDPFQKVQGLDAIYKVFKHMYKTLHEPRFIVEEIVENEHVAYLRWYFFYKRSKNAAEESFEGVSRVLFRADSKVLSHTDYWDAAHNVYEKVPFLGAVLRFIKRRLHA